MGSFFSGVLASCIGAFVGFAFALIGDRLITINRKRKSIDTVLKLTKDELTKSIESIKAFQASCEPRCPEKSDASAKSILSPFALPAREVLVSSGQFLELVNSKYINVYKAISAAYIQMDLYASILHIIKPDDSKAISDQLNDIKEACTKAIVEIEWILKK